MLHYVSNSTYVERLIHIIPATWEPMIVTLLSSRVGPRALSRCATALTGLTATTSIARASGAEHVHEVPQYPHAAARLVPVAAQRG